MRLRDLSARFVSDADAHGQTLSDRDTVEGMQGVVFQCPSCGAGITPVVDDERFIGGQPRRCLPGAHFIRVFFANPRGTAPAPVEADPPRLDGKRNPRWQLVSGTTLDDLTLSPSINCNIPWKDITGGEHPSTCQFHGYVRNGSVE